MYYIPFERGKTKFFKNINFMKIGTGVPRQFYPDFGQVCRRNPCSEIFETTVSFLKT